MWYKLPDAGWQCCIPDCKNQVQWRYAPKSSDESTYWCDKHYHLSNVPKNPTPVKTYREMMTDDYAKSQVNHPSHYGGENNPYEAIKVIEAWELGFNLGNTVKYISRAGKKNNNKLTDLEKAKWYLEREIKNLKK